MKRYLLVLYLITLITCDDQGLEEDKIKCEDAQATKEKCTSVQLKFSENHCCLAYEESNKEDAECQFVEEKDYDTFSNSKSFAYEKEIIGFDCYNDKSPEKNDDCESLENENYEYIYECKDGRATVTSKLYSFTDQEKQILQKENHCLTYFYKLFGEQPYTSTEKDCSEAELTQQAKKEGITCGFYELVYVPKNKNEGKEDLTKKTCYLLNPNAINNESKAKKDLKEFALNLVPDMDDEDFDTIQISMSDNSEHSFSYDSKAGTLIDQNQKNDENKKDDNNSKLISFSKLLFLLLLISL